MSKKTDFEVMSEMIQRKLDISCSTHLVSANADPRGGVVTMGVDMATVTKLTLGRYRAILYVVEEEEFFKIKNRTDD